MKVIMSVISFALLFVYCPPSASGTISLSKNSPQVGEEIIISFDVPVDTLMITYRPNSRVVKREFLVNSPPATFMEWTSKNPGLVELSYWDRSGSTPTKVSHNLSVRFDGFSTSGLIVMLLAGFILFGGAGFAFRTLFRDQDEDKTLDFDPETLPDT